MNHLCKITTISTLLAILLMSGCSSKDEPKPINKSESGMMIEEAEAIVAYRQQQKIIDITKITRLVAILAKQQKEIQQDISNANAMGGSVDEQAKKIKEHEEKISSMQAAIESLSKDTGSAKAMVSELEKSFISAQKRVNLAKSLDKAKGIKFEDVTGDIEVKSYIANIRSAPTVANETWVRTEKRGTVMAFIGKSKRWYKLTDDNYIHSSIVCEQCNDDNIIAKAEGEPLDKEVASKSTKDSNLSKVEVPTSNEKEKHASMSAEELKAALLNKRALRKKEEAQREAAIEQAELSETKNSDGPVLF